MATVFVMLNIIAARPLQQAAAGLEEDHRQYLPIALGQVEAWYVAQAATVDATASTIDAATVRAAALTQPRYNIQLAVSSRLGLPCASGTPVTVCVPYRRIAVWIPASSEASTASFDASTGNFTPGNALQWGVFDGRTVQVALANESWRALDRTAAALQRYAVARSAMEPIGSARANFMRPSDCSKVPADEIGCVDTYTDAAGSTLQTTLGLTTGELRSAWGTPIQFSNLQGSQTTTPPYTSALRTSTPWGGSIQITAVQPI